MANFRLNVQGFQPVIGTMEAEVVTPPTPQLQYYMHGEDVQVFGSVRACAPCPAVFVLKDDPHVKMTEQWQYYLYAINSKMELRDVFLLLGDSLAFANRTGFVSLSSPRRADYFFRRELSNELPRLDKVRTTARSILTGVEQFSALTLIGETLLLAKNIVQRRNTFLSTRQAFASLVNGNNVLNVRLFDSRQPPPLKPGRSYPTNINDVTPDDYLYLPQYNPEMFLVANIVKNNGDVYQFPRGALYPWFLGGKTTVSFVPHIANFGYGDVLYPLRKLVKLPMGEPLPSPYRLT